MADAAPITPAVDKPEPGFIGAVKEVAAEFSADDVMTQGAALAFYSGLAIAPLLTVAVWCAALFFGAEAKSNIVGAFEQVMGPQAAAPIAQLLDPASAEDRKMTISGIISILILAFSASSVFGQLQTALNSMWHVRAKPGNSILGFINKRLLSLGMLASILFLLMTSLVVSTVIEGVVGTRGAHNGRWFMVVINNLISLGLFTVLFAALFKYVPDAKIAMRPTWIGAVISAVLFTIGKYGLSYYLGRGSYESSYGAAIGSFVALLVWVYYSSIIVLVGAEVTEVYARRSGHLLEPDEHAVRVETEEVQIESTPTGNVRT